MENQGLWVVYRESSTSRLVHPKFKDSESVSVYGKLAELAYSRKQESTSQEEAATVMDASDKKILKPKQQGPADISEPMLEQLPLFLPRMSHLFPGAAATVPEGSEEDEIHSCTTPRGSNIFSESGPGESSISQAEAATVMEASDKKILKPSREENLVVKQQGHVDNSELLLESYSFPEAAATVPEGSEADEIHPHTTPRGSNIFFESELGFCSLLPLTVYSSAPNLSFNKDCCCFATGTDYNFKIYSCEPFREIFRHDFDHSGIGAVKMNKMMIWDDHKRQCIGELTFQSEVCGVQLRWDRIVVVLEQKISIYNFADLKLVHQIETISNPKGLCAVSHAAGSIILVCPGLHKGRVRVALYASKRTQFITAHNSRIACFALTQDGRLLATCSSKGTLVRIFNTVDGSLLQEVWRGVDRAEIYSLAFSSTAQWLAVSSDKGTVHVFGLKANLANLRSDKPHVASDANHAVSSPALSLSYMKEGAEVFEDEFVL